MPQFLDRLYGEREAALALIDEVTGAAEADERDLSDAEQAVITRNQARVADELDPQIVIAEATETARGAHVRAAGGAPPPRGQAVEVIDREGEVVYRSFAEYARDQLISRYDAIAQRAGGAAARQAAEQRIERAVANTISSDVPGLLPPQYLTTIFDIISKARPIVSSARSVNLTSGLLRYPHITQKPIVGKQTAEKTEAPSQKMTVSFVDVPADTYVGAGDISWQVINWSTPDALALFFDLMAEQYARQTEAAAGAVLAALTQAGPPATDDLAGWSTAITTAAALVYTASGRMANTIYADVATGYHLLSLVSASRPVFLNTSGADLSSSTAASIGGLSLVISKGLAAKHVVVADSSALLVAETAGAPVELRAVEPALGGMEVGIIGAFVAKIVDAGALREYRADRMSGDGEVTDRAADDLPASSELEYEVPEQEIAGDGPSSHELDQFPAGDPDVSEDGPASSDDDTTFPADADRLRPKGGAAPAPDPTAKRAETPTATPITADPT